MDAMEQGIDRLRSEEEFMRKLPNVLADVIQSTCWLERLLAKKVLTEDESWQANSVFLRFGMEESRYGSIYGHHLTMSDYKVIPNETIAEKCDKVRKYALDLLLLIEKRSPIPVNVMNRTMAEIHNGLLEIAANKPKKRAA